MQLSAQGKGKQTPFDPPRLVLDMFQEQVERRPDNVAVRDGAREITFRELDLAADRVAHELRRRYLRVEEPVMTVLPASAEFLASILGILKAGGTYFPMDAGVPRQRLEFLLGDSKTRFVLSDAKGLEWLGEGAHEVIDTVQLLAGPREDGDEPAMPGNPGRRAYITYTSGSTGQPKGVEIEHHSLSNFVACYHQRFQLTPEDRASLLAYVAFDASVSDIWPVLCAGGSLVAAPQGILLEPDRLIAWLAEEEITIAFVPTGLVEILFGRPWPRQIKLRILVTGGDRLRGRPPEGLPFLVMNGYGPTENTVFSTWSVVTPERGEGRPPPIGTPLPNTTAYVLNEQLQRVAPQEAGELYVGGEQVARGYLGRPELTAQRFLPDPFSAQPGARMYRTGDWARWLPDGELEFLGRRDDQIQIRGRRVELGEIEAIIASQPSVRRVCCVPQLDGGMPCGVVAHVVPQASATDLREPLRAFLNSQLPDYMVPSRLVMHEELPLTPQGKVNRAALAARPPVEAVTDIPATSGDLIVDALADLWHALLPAAAGAPAETTFAELGGDSLLAMQLVLGIEGIIHQPLELSAFLATPTFPGLCAIVKTRLAGAQFQPAVTLSQRGDGPPLFFVHGHTGDIDHYFPLVEALGTDQTIVGIRSPALAHADRLPPSMEAAAETALAAIRTVQPHGSPALVGYSFGGLLAFEIARQAAAQEGTCGFTALIGATSPLRATNYADRLAHFARWFPAWAWQLLRDHSERARRLRNWRAMADHAKHHLAGTHLPEGGWAKSAISHHMLGLMEKYQPAPRSGVPVELFRGRGEYHRRAHPLYAWETYHLPDAGWSAWTRGANRVHWVEGDHWTMIKQPAAAGLAQAIRQAMGRPLSRPVPAGAAAVP
jgi:amino acid adenylation domain-containing protein